MFCCCFVVCFFITVNLEHQVVKWQIWFILFNRRRDPARQGQFQCFNVYLKHQSPAMQIMSVTSKYRIFVSGPNTRALFDHILQISIFKSTEKHVYALGSPSNMLSFEYCTSSALIRLLRSRLT